MQRLWKNVSSEVKAWRIFSVFVIIGLLGVSFMNLESQRTVKEYRANSCEMDICNRDYGLTLCFGLGNVTCDTLELKCNDKQYMGQWEFENCTFTNSTCECMQADYTKINQLAACVKGCQLTTQPIYNITVSPFEIRSMQYRECIGNCSEIYNWTKP